jgi:hypothetical protein
MSDDAVRVARRWFDEVWNKQRRETIYELMIVEGWDGWDSTGLLTQVGGASIHPDVARASAAGLG